MNSPTHSLLALALLSKQGETKRNWAVLIGSLFPDIVIYIWAPYQRFIKGESGARIWNELYFEAPMQDLIAVFNSIPIYAAIAVLGFAVMKKADAEAETTQYGPLLLFFALAALIHMTTDLPVHAHDAYRHFWPISDWRFYSPLSYYEAGKHSAWVSLFETALALCSIFILWRRFPKKWVRITLGIFAAIYIGLNIILRLVPFHFPI
ncbi:MAG: hypothetical protein ACPGVT_03650 [Maricaulaceae bacterium]